MKGVDKGLGKMSNRWKVRDVMAVTSTKKQLKELKNGKLIEIA